MNKKKKHLKIGRLFLLIVFLGLFSSLCYFLFKVPIMSVQISGNNMLTDDEVLEIAKIDDYPSFFGTLMIATKNNLEKSKYVSSAKVTKGLLNFKIKIKEEKVLYIDKGTNEKVTKENRIKDDKIVCAPFLVNEVPKDKEKSFLKAMDKIKNDILCQMSEIKYDPNEIDKDRYYVSMNDGNSVYLTVNKFNKINQYNTILENVGKQNGTLYLDYGDYFQAK